MLRIVASLAPIIVLVTLGAALLRFRFYGNEFRQQLDRLVYWVCLPALFIDKLAMQPRDPSAAGATLAVLAAATLVAIAMGYGLAAALRLPPAQRGVFVQGGYRGNLAFVGLPVLLLVETPAAERLQTEALLVIGPSVIFYNVSAVLVLELARRPLALRALPGLLRSVAMNPLLLGCVLGMALGQLGVAWPRPVTQVLQLLGAPAGPLALLSLGGTLVVHPIGHRLGIATIAALVKVALVPLIAWALGTWMGLDRESLFIALVFASTPTAVASFVMARQMAGDERLAAAIVVLTTLLSTISLAVALTFA